MSASTNDEVILLTGKDDMFHGVTVDSNLLAETPVAFEKQLEKSLEAWRQAKRRGIWLSIPHDRTELIPIAQRFGFVLHHAVSDHVMLTNWLDENEPNQLPTYATSAIGVGGLVVNSKRQVLLVQERFASVKDYFKLPGGALDLGEPIEQGVEREVFEETGIRAHFRGILMFTHTKRFRFGHGDIYFVCFMSLDENEEDQKINFDPLEIAKCEWISLEDWASSVDRHPVPITLHAARLALDVIEGREQLLEPHTIEVKRQNPQDKPWRTMMYAKKSSEQK